MNDQNALLPEPSADGLLIRETPTAQHIDRFLQATTTVTLDAALVSLDELEGLYVYWCSLNDQEPSATQDVLTALEQQGVEPLTRDGVEYVEGLVLTGGVVTEFIVSCEFAGTWGAPSVEELVTARDAAAAS
ncbi:hypothetical protein [Arthrobacter sp. Ld5]|uniref:hypothetical protein n=1 Tax=Arthrobacter sp. Ld5 TaxID=649152 RepID=UPI003EBC7E96